MRIVWLVAWIGSRDSSKVEIGTDRTGCEIAALAGRASEAERVPTISPLELPKPRFPASQSSGRPIALERSEPCLVNSDTLDLLGVDA